jgi:hypothetical protein
MATPRMEAEAGYYYSKLFHENTINPHSFPTTSLHLPLAAALTQFGSTGWGVGGLTKHELVVVS